MTWKVKKSKKKIKNIILIEGLPGIGNVGKIAADLLVQEFDAKTVAEFSSYSMPNTVFIQDDNLVQLPSIEAVYFKHKKQDYVFIVGDHQPTEEAPSYELTEAILEYAGAAGCKEIITLGGIGLQNLPKKPKVYCTANNEKTLKELAKNGANPKIYGKVGPLMGVSGLLLGMGGKKKIKAGALLAETLAHPMYLGLKGAREILKLLNRKYDFEVSMKDLDKEIKDMEDNLKQNLANTQNLTPEGRKEMSYIG